MTLSSTQLSSVKHRPVFLLRGSGSSGTNWACALLNLHPHIYCSGEWCFEPIRAGVERWESQDWTISGSSRMRQIVRDKLGEMVRECLNAEADRARPGARWVGDRSPEAVREIVPGAPAILTIRDGRDVLVSMTLRYLREDAERRRTGTRRSPMIEGWPAMARAADEFARDPSAFVERGEGLFADEAWVRRCAANWATRVREDLAAIDRLGDHAIVVRYEAMHEDAERERRRMYALLGVGESLASPISRESRTSAGFEREDASSFYRAGRVGDWKRWMRDAERVWYEDEAGAELDRLGYEIGGGPPTHLPAQAGASGGAGRFAD